MTALKIVFLFACVAFGIALAGVVSCVQMLRYRPPVDRVRPCRARWIYHRGRLKGMPYGRWTPIELTPSVGLSRAYFVGD
jgi:hypothetical protein